MTTTADMIEGLRKRYPQRAGKWANVVEFENIDFMAVACWASLEFAVHGHEVKVSRGDWLKELKNPNKSSPTMAMCDFWWLVAPKGVAKEEELPERWGFLEHNGYSFWCVRQAELLRSQVKERYHGWDPQVRGLIPNPEYHSRYAFAKLARRYAYAQADRDALLAAVPEPQPLLDAAAVRTGRWTKDQREDQAEWRKRVKAMNRKRT